MAKKILLVESDNGFAREMSSALEQKGFETRTTGDGKEALDLARDERPDAIVLCVELPKLSGYSICAKLKKDETLKTIPVIITSAEATPETFEQHRQLKTRAEDYLLKPFEPSQLLERLTALVGPLQSSEEEVVTLADVELEALAEPEQEAAPLELSPAMAAPAEDEDLRLLDNAFENIAVPSQEADGTAELPPEDEAPLGEEGSPSSAARSEDEPAMAFGANQQGEALSPPTPGAAVASREEPPAPSAEDHPTSIRGANLSSLRAAGIPVLDSSPMTSSPLAAPPMAASFAEPIPVRSAAAPDLSRALASKEHEIESARRELTDRDAELRQLRERIQDLERRVAQSAADLARSEANQRAREAELSTVQARLENLSTSTKRLESDLRSSREDAHRAGEKAQHIERELAQTRRRAEDAERALGEKASETAEVLAKLEAAEQKLESQRSELAEATREASDARNDLETRTGALQKRVQELETTNTKNEERVVKAYQKIKGDEKLREKTRKALTIALQLLDEHGYSSDPENQRPSAREH